MFDLKTDLRGELISNILKFKYIKKIICYLKTLKSIPFTVCIRTCFYNLKQIYKIKTFLALTLLNPVSFFDNFIFCKNRIDLKIFDFLSYTYVKVLDEQRMHKFNIQKANKGGVNNIPLHHLAYHIVILFPITTFKYILTHNIKKRPENDHTIFQNHIIGENQYKTISG